MPGARPPSVAWVQEEEFRNREIYSLSTLVVGAKILSVHSLSLPVDEDLEHALSGFDYLYMNDNVSFTYLFSVLSTFAKELA